MSRQPVTISFWRGALPHWEVVDGRYFVTVRLANSLPRRVIEDLAALLGDVEQSDYLNKSRKYFNKMEQWLDKNTGDAWFSSPEVAGIVKATIEKYSRLGYWHMIASVTMPNHVHLFFRCGSRPLSQVMRDFKRYTGRACNQVLNRKGMRFWQREWFDHWSRSVQEDDKIVSYIRNNPARAGLVLREDAWLL
ncbi:MAG: transposase [Kiritimatiellae bacterium]|nr:transposase [Kiritimatiellia bacterium]